MIQDALLYSVITMVYIVWLLLVVKKSGVRSLYFLFYFLTFIIFYGPLMYYKLGFRVYSYSISNDALEKFMYIGTYVGIINIIFYFLYRGKFFVRLKNMANNIVTIKEKNEVYVKVYFIIFLLFVINYISVYYKSFPLVQLFTMGELGERLDTVSLIPFYITFSAIAMIIVPTAFLFFKERMKNQFLKIIFFLFVLFVLTVGGNKGMVSFFLIFYILLAVQRVNLFKLLIVFVSLFTIYAVTKGVLSLNSETMAYLIESPFRRLFATQGVGFIVRIEMMDTHQLLTDSRYIIKRQVFSMMYNQKLGSGSAPTIFIAEILVKYKSYFLMIASYIVYLSIILQFIFNADKYLNHKKYAYLLWNVFLLFYFTTMSEFGVANILRYFLIISNLSAIYILGKKV